MEIKFDFDEVHLSGEGLMAWGTATLEGACDDDNEFFVSEIVLVGGQRLVASGAGFMGFPSEINKALFKAISSQIENDKCPVGYRAALEWSDAVAGNLPEFSVFRRRVGMPMAEVG